MTTAVRKPNLQIWPIERLKPYEKNAKLHPEEELALLEKSIRATGWDQPIVVEADGTIIKGHGRRLVALRMGLKEVPVDVRDDLTKAQADAARINDNNAFGMRYDTVVLQEEIRRLMAEAPEITLDDLVLSDKDRELLTQQLDEANADAILGDAGEEAERQKAEDRERIEKADAEMVPVAKAFGFSKVRKADERTLTAFMAEAEAATGKEGYEAFIEGLRLAAQRGLT